MLVISCALLVRLSWVVFSGFQVLGACFLVRCSGWYRSYVEGVGCVLVGVCFSWAVNLYQCQLYNSRLSYTYRMPATMLLVIAVDTRDR